MEYLIRLKQKEKVVLETINANNIQENIKSKGWYEKILIKKHTNIQNLERHLVQTDIQV